MQAHAGAPQAAEALTQFGRAVRQHLLLDLVELARQAVGDSIHRVGDILDDALQ